MPNHGWQRGGVVCVLAQDEAANEEKSKGNKMPEAEGEFVGETTNTKVCGHAQTRFKRPEKRKV